MSSVWRVLFFHSYHLGKLRVEWPRSSYICDEIGVRTGCTGLPGTQEPSRPEPAGLGWVRSEGPIKEAPAPSHLFRCSYLQSCSHWVTCRTLNKVGYLQGTFWFFYIVMRPPIQMFCILKVSGFSASKKIITTTLYLIKNQI